MTHRPNVAKHIFLPIITISIFLSVIGLLFIFESSSVRSFNEYGDSFYYLKRQSIFLIPALLSLAFFSNFDYRKLHYLAFPAMITTMVFLVIVLIPSIGSRVGGARRWIDLGFFNIQPTELTKFSVILYLSSWFIRKENKRFYTFLFFIGILMFLIILQPDMGTATIIFFLSICIYFLAGEDLLKLLIFLPFSMGMFYMLVKLSSYRFNRLLAFFDPSRDPLGITYHINQILISLTNGGFFGQGLGASRQKYMFLPEAHTDSIFAIVGEEVGLFGSVILICGFMYLMFKLYQITKYAPDKFAKLLAGGIFALFNLQILINLAAMVNLVPLTGVPLPFISYGGSNLLVSFALLGIMISIGKKIKTI